MLLAINTIQRTKNYNTDSRKTRSYFAGMIIDFRKSLIQLLLLYNKISIIYREKFYVFLPEFYCKVF